MQSTLMRLVPEALLRLLRPVKRAMERRRNATRSVEEVFTDIYLNRRWGGRPDEFCSGSGTRDARVVDAYVGAVAEWLQKQAGGEGLVVVDLGCGDFTVGRQLVAYCSCYVGVDVVKPLIEHHQSNFAGATIEFAHLNIITDELPEGDVCLVRQVLQHLSNNEISIILGKLRKYRWALLTEHIPSSEQGVVPNLDKPHGSDIRITMNSGVYPEHPPFSFPRTRMQSLLEVPWEGHEGGVLRTVVLHHEDA